MKKNIEFTPEEAKKFKTPAEWAEYIYKNGQKINPIKRFFNIAKSKISRFFIDTALKLLINDTLKYQEKNTDILRFTYVLNKETTIHFNIEFHKKRVR